MPLFTVTMQAGRPAGEIESLSSAIHAASVAAGYPANDLFQRFLSLEPSHFRVDPNDIMVFFLETDRANGSFGGDLFAPPVTFM